MILKNINKKQVLISIILLLYVALASYQTYLLKEPQKVNPFGDEVEVVYHDIHGTNKTDLVEDIVKNGVKDYENNWRYAFTAWSINWEYIYDEDDYVKEVVFIYDITVNLPYWVDYDKSNIFLKIQWNRFIDRIVKHENNHVQFFLDGVKEIESSAKSLIESKPHGRGEMTQRIKELVAKIEKLDIDYDQKTKNGKEEGIEL